MQSVNMRSTVWQYIVRVVMHENWSERPELSESLQLTVSNAVSLCALRALLLSDQRRGRCTIKHTHSVN